MDNLQITPVYALATAVIVPLYSSGQLNSHNNRRITEINSDYYMIIRDFSIIPPNKADEVE